MKNVIIRIFSLVISIAVLYASTYTVLSSDEYKNIHVNTGDQASDIINIAKTQIGFREGENNDTKYGTWYGLPNQPWCAMFVSWCARQANVPLDVLENCAIAAPDPGYFNIRYFDGEVYTPEQGDLFFTKNFTHVGLVDYSDGEYFYTVEGNTNDSGSDQGIGVFALKRVTNDYYFGVPDYNYRSQKHMCNKAVFVATSDEHPHYADYICSYCGITHTDDSVIGYESDCVLCRSSVPMLLGDANADRNVNVKDATYIQKYLAELADIPDDMFMICDADTDNVITVKDSTVIRKYIAGIVVNTPVGEPLI
ncbi:MAG: CHAP domain-containing protein [Ruminococcus sp.]|nr:CHAP domain-containing protein [Ruminococcus sp.]